MLIPVVLAFAVLVGVPWPILGIVGLAHVAPWPALAVFVVAAGLAVRRKRLAPDVADEASWLAAVAAELRSGASLRSSLAAAAPSAPSLDVARLARLADAGAPEERMASAAAAVLPSRGMAVGAALTTAGAAGGRVAVVFERLAADAWADVEAYRAMLTLTAQARLSAWVVGGLPLVVLGVLAVTGRLGAVLGSGPVAMAVMAFGLVLELAGVAVVVAVVKAVGR